MQYKAVENPRKRSFDYQEGEPLSQAFVFFGKNWHDKAIEWCKEHKVEYHELEYKDNEVSLIVTTYSTQSADSVFNELGNLDSHFLTTLSSMWVDIII